MNVTGILIIVFIVIAVILGLIIGLCKGFAKVKSWGVEYLLACLVTVLVGGALERNSTSGIISLCTAIASMLLFTLTSAIFRKIFKSSKKRKIAKGKRKSGPSGFFDSIFGGVTLAVKGFVIAGVLSAFMLVALDISQFAFVTAPDGMFAAVYASGAWTALKPYMMDFFYLAAIMLALKCGYQSGISNVLWTFVMILIVAFAGLSAYHLSFNVEAFQAPVQGLANVIGGEKGVSDTTVMIAQWVMTAGLFLMMLVVVILIGIFVPKLLNFARNGKIFFVIDGIFGALFSVLIVMGLLLFCGSLVQPLYDLEFMAKFTSYFEKSGFATYFYDNNLLALFGMQPVLPLKDWFTQSAQ